MVALVVDNTKVLPDTSGPDRRSLSPTTSFVERMRCQSVTTRPWMVPPQALVMRLAVSLGKAVVGAIGERS